MDNIFGLLCAQDLHQLQSDKTSSTVKAGQVLFYERSRPQGVYCINSGRIKLFKTGIDGKEQILRISGKGKLIGYHAMLVDEVHFYSAQTLEETTVCYIPRDEFLEAVYGNPALQKRLLRIVLEELKTDDNSLLDLAQRSVRERTAAVLLMLNDTYAGSEERNAPVEISLSREDLANIVGTATETLIRQLQDFKEESFIESKGRKLLIKDLVGLGRVARKKG